jgi:hypothetical protein
MARAIGVALVHHPVVARDGGPMTASITNLDLHDLARCVRTYGLAALYVVHPLLSQRMLAERILRHWVSGSGRERIPDRGTALETARIVADLAAARADLGSDTALWVTAARATSHTTTFAEARSELAREGRPVLLCFGTGWGLAPELLAAADLRLPPIRAERDSGYNHLSVRAACAVTLDRLFG